MNNKILLWGLYLLLPAISLSQTIHKLDEKHGYKDIKLDQNINKYQGQIEFFQNNQYRFTGACCQEVFDMEATDIILSVDEKNVIIRIDIAIQDYDSAGKTLGYISKQFENLFGKPTGASKLDDESSFIYLWKGEDTYIFLVEKYFGYKVGWIPLITVGRVQDLDDGF